MSAAAREGFAGSGAIGRYWQTRCCGFEVRSDRGRRLGEVEALELDRETRAAVLLVVRRRRKTLRLRPECVQVVDPWRQSLVVALPRRKPVVAPAARSLARGARASGTRTVGLAQRLPPAASRVAQALSWAAPRALLVAGLVAWFYAVIVFTLVRVVLLVLAALTVGTARRGARLRPHLHGRPARI